MNKTIQAFGTTILIGVCAKISLIIVDGEPQGFRIILLGAIIYFVVKNSLGKK